jgi:hypothetical protein
MARQDLDLVRRAATAALKRLRSPRRGDDEGALALVREQLNDHFSALGVDTLEELQTEEDLSLARELLTATDVDQLAFGRAVEAVASNEYYLGIVVAEIGYRRTKRGETSRRNDLFSATVTREGVTSTVRNLNSAGGHWRITTDVNGSDALSLLSEARLWH